MNFTRKTYYAAYQRALKIADQAMIDHARAFRGPDMAIKWYHTAFLINKRFARKQGAFWAFWS